MSRLSRRVVMLAMLAVTALATAGFGQPGEEEEDPAHMKPNPVERTGLTPPDVLAVKQISALTRTVNGRTYLPVADLARALGGTPPRPGDPGGPIHLQPGANGLLELNPSARASTAAMSRSSIQEQKVQKVSPGEQKVHKVSPAPTERSAVPSPSTLTGRGGAADSQTGSLFVGASLVSRGIIIINGMPMLPMDDLAAALGAKIVNGRGGLAFERMPGARSILSF